MGELSKRQVLLGPGAVTGAMLAAALWVSIQAGIDGSHVLIDYVITGAAITGLCILIWMFIEVAKMAHQGIEEPLTEIRIQFPKSLDLIILPALVFPLFLGAFTTTKTGIPFLVGFRWDQFWTDMDHAIFGIDPWRATHALFGIEAIKAFNFFYTFIWGMALAFSKSFIAIYANRRYVAQFFTAMLLTWLVGGFIGAYSLSSAGPVFVHLTDPALAPRFAELRHILDQTLPAQSGVRLTQSYLAQAIDSKIAVRGGGISAMPSMHVAAATIFVLAAKEKKWRYASVLFWLATFVGSVHFGYHYALDGVVGAIFAAFCWLLTSEFVSILSGDKPVSGRKMAQR